MTDAHEPDRQDPEAIPPEEVPSARPDLAGEGPTVRPDLTGEGPTVRLTRPVTPPPGERTTVPIRPAPGLAAGSPVDDGPTVPASADEITDVAASAAGPLGGEIQDAASEPVIIGVDAVPVSSGDSVPVPEKGLDLGERSVPLAGEPAASTKGEGLRKAGRLTSAGALIWVLLALFGFTLVVQLRSNNTDEGLATARQEDLVRILSDLEARDTRLQGEITTLEQSQRQLTSGVEGRQAALAEAGKRADELGLLAGTLAGRGPGLKIVIDPKGAAVKASAILNAVQELRGAGGEVMEIAGPGGPAVRIVASSYFVDADAGGIVVDGLRVTGPYTLWVIGAPQTMQTALQIPGGVDASVNSAGGSVTMEAQTMVEVTAVHRATSLQYARPVS